MCTWELTPQQQVEWTYRAGIDTDQTHRVPTKGAYVVGVAWTKIQNLIRKID